MKYGCLSISHLDNSKCVPFKIDIKSDICMHTAKSKSIIWLSHKRSNQVTPGNRGTYWFWSVSTAVSAAATVSAAAAVLSTLFNFPGKPLKLISSNHTQLTYGCGKIYWHPSRWPWVKVTKLPKRDVIYLVPTIKWELLIQSLQSLVGIFPLSFW